MSLRELLDSLKNNASSVPGEAIVCEIGGFTTFF